ncbi:hypothetical protein [Nocardioides sp. Soil796]|uniref:hypothetical protein n=1 Tax=Nocardioides sp. Soil796 TaxID=1736412 RepID=UPI0009E74A91|nr:hypothetical protein [Nocardioides sp. Soil796]
MSERKSWTVTTHDWSRDLDLAHLAEVRDHTDRYGAGGRRHMILEVLAYANDEAESIGRVGHAVVTFHDDGRVRVSDDGRGTDTRVDSVGAVVRKPVMATKDLRFFDGLDGPLLPDGLPRRGMSTVSALSSVLVHENHRAEGSWSQTYRHGVPEAALCSLRAASDSGTSVEFVPRTSIGGPDSLEGSDLQAFSWLHINLLAE